MLRIQSIMYLILLCRFSKISMLREPLLLVVAFFTFFALAMIYVR